jgi:hypothetical protein
MYWTETQGGQLLSGQKLTKSCSVYKEEDDIILSTEVICISKNK